MGELDKLFDFRTCLKTGIFRIRLNSHLMFVVPDALVDQVDVIEVDVFLVALVVHVDGLERLLYLLVLVRKYSIEHVIHLYCIFCRFRQKLHVRWLYLGIIRGGGAAIFLLP